MENFQLTLLYERMHTLSALLPCLKSLKLIVFISSSKAPLQGRASRYAITIFIIAWFIASQWAEPWTGTIGGNITIKHWMMMMMINTFATIKPYMQMLSRASFSLASLTMWGCISILSYRASSSVDCTEPYKLSKRQNNLRLSFLMLYVSLTNFIVCIDNQFKKESRVNTMEIKRTYSWSKSLTISQNQHHKCLKFRSRKSLQHVSEHLHFRI